MKKLLIATGNSHKTREIRAILDHSFEISDLKDHPEVPAAEETGTTFKANASLKAIEASLCFDGLVLSDDSGIEADALNKAPGVYSARYAGTDGGDAANNLKLLAELKRVSATGSQRSGRFRCVMVLAERGEVVAVFDGKVEGIIIEEERGTGGFGYDPLFVPEGQTQTFGELPAAVKNTMSHRSRALAQVTEFLTKTR